MRKSILLSTFILTIIISCGSIFGQKNRTRDAEYFPRHEFYVQYGAPTIIELSSTLRPPTAKGKKEMIPKNALFSGVGGIGYNFSISEQLSIGIYGGISLSSADIYSSLNDKEVFEYSSDIVSYTGQISAHWIYYEQGALQASSGVYLGLNYRDDKIKPLPEDFSQTADRVNALDFAYHLTAIKIRYGNMIGGFAELGFGYRGLVNIGLSIQL